MRGNGGTVLRFGDREWVPWCYNECAQGMTGGKGSYKNDAQLVQKLVGMA
jgi:hypothetical protein